MPEPQQPGSTLIPSFRYRDAHAAIDWLERILGFTRHAVYTGADNTVEHAELRHGTGMIMIGSVKPATSTAPTAGAEQWTQPSEIGDRITSPMYLIVSDCHPLWEGAQAGGAHVLMPLQTMPYGGQAFCIRDPEGFHWSVGEYDPWKALEAATATQPASNPA